MIGKEIREPALSNFIIFGVLPKYDKKKFPILGALTAQQ